MIYLCFRHTVADYARWKEKFDTHLSARQAGGAIGETYVLRNFEEPNEILVLMGWRDLNLARLFTQSYSLQMALKKMEVVSETEIRFLERVG